MKITTYQEKYKQQIIDLVLFIENQESKIDLSLEEQPDLLDIPTYYEKNGGMFLVAVEGDEVVGTLAFMNYGDGNAVMKKFFVRRDYRGTKLGLTLYQKVLAQLQEQGYRYVLLDTPSVAIRAHRFYERAGFRKISGDEAPFDYCFPDRDCYLYLLTL